jgi:hypothetical protein
MRSSGDVSYLDKDKMLYELVLFSLWNLITMKCPDYLLSAIIHDFVEIRGFDKEAFLNDFGERSKSYYSVFQKNDKESNPLIGLAFF